MCDALLLELQKLLDEATGAVTQVAPMRLSLINDLFFSVVLLYYATPNKQLHMQSRTA
jgi:hypothetical protein